MDVDGYVIIRVDGTRMLHALHPRQYNAINGCRRINICSHHEHPATAAADASMRSTPVLQTSTLVHMLGWRQEMGTSGVLNPT